MMTSDRQKKTLTLNVPVFHSSPCSREGKKNTQRFKANWLIERHEKARWAKQMSGRHRGLGVLWRQFEPFACVTAEICCTDVRVWHASPWETPLSPWWLTVCLRHCLGVGKTLETANPVGTVGSVRNAMLSCSCLEIQPPRRDRNNGWTLCQRIKVGSLTLLSWGPKHAGWHRLALLLGTNTNFLSGNAEHLFHPEKEDKK